MTTPEISAALLLKALGCATPTERQIRTLLALAARVAKDKFSWDFTKDIVIDHED